MVFTEKHKLWNHRSRKNSENNEQPTLSGSVSSQSKGRHRANYSKVQSRLRDQELYLRGAHGPRGNACVWKAQVRHFRADGAYWCGAPRSQKTPFKTSLDTWFSFFVCKDCSLCSQCDETDLGGAGKSKSYFSPRSNRKQLYSWALCCVTSCSEQDKSLLKTQLLRCELHGSEKYIWEKEQQWDK